MFYKRNRLLSTRAKKYLSTFLLFNIFLYYLLLKVRVSVYNNELTIYIWTKHPILLKQHSVLATFLVSSDSFYQHNSIEIPRDSNKTENLRISRKKYPAAWCEISIVLFSKIHWYDFLAKIGLVIIVSVVLFKNTLNYVFSSNHIKI